MSLQFQHAPSLYCDLNHKVWHHICFFTYYRFVLQTLKNDNSSYRNDLRGVEILWKN
jgi:hypothetical protein